jgi:hypothetical protein
VTDGFLKSAKSYYKELWCIFIMNLLGEGVRFRVVEGGIRFRVSNGVFVL